MMLVKCVANDVNALPEGALKARLSEQVRLDHPISELSLGTVYPVQAITKWKDGSLMYYLHTIEEFSYPYPYPSEFFEVVDDSLPGNWCIRIEVKQENRDIKQISFAEWARNAQFYEHLIDDDPECVELYLKNRRTL